MSIAAALAWLCRAQLGNPRCHGFYRYFAFVGLAWLLIDAVPVWGMAPRSPRQILSQCLLLGSLGFLAGGLYQLKARGGCRAQDGPREHFQFENTARLVTTGLYRRVRHPMYTSLLLLNWGLFLKSPVLPGLGRYCRGGVAPDGPESGKIWCCSAPITRATDSPARCSCPGCTDPRCLSVGNRGVLAVIRINQLNYRYAPDAPLSLVDLNLSVPAGSLFGLLGPNGAGKTTLLSLLGGLLPCPPGRITADGQDLAAGTSRGAPGLSLVPQEHAFYSPLSVIDNLSIFAGVQGLGGADRRDRIGRAVRVTGLEDWLDKRADTLSGGLKRRLNLAIGLLNRPRILLLDEPTVGIDPHSRHFILETIRQLNADGVTVIYTSHYMEEVEKLCDHIAVMDRGRTLLQGPLDATRRASGGQVLAVRTARAVPPETVERLSTLNVLLHREGQLDLVVADFDRGGEVLEALRPFDIQSVRYGGHTLESLFLHLTHRELRD